MTSLSASHITSSLADQLYIHQTCVANIRFGGIFLCVYVHIVLRELVIICLCAYCLYCTTHLHTKWQTVGPRAWSLFPYLEACCTSTRAIWIIYWVNHWAMCSESPCKSVLSSLGWQRRQFCPMTQMSLLLWIDTLRLHIALVSQPPVVHSDKNAVHTTRLSLCPFANKVWCCGMMRIGVLVADPIANKTFFPASCIDLG